MSDMLNSLSMSLVVRRPRSMALASHSRAKETASPVNPRTLTLGKWAMTRWICSTRSSSVKKGALSGLMPTPTTSRSKSRLPRWITSMCPRWIGSNVPG